MTHTDYTMTGMTHTANYTLTGMTHTADYTLTDMTHTSDSAFKITIVYLFLPVCNPNPNPTLTDMTHTAAN